MRKNRDKFEVIHPVAETTAWVTAIGEVACLNRRHSQNHTTITNENSKQIIPSTKCRRLIIIKKTPMMVTHTYTYNDI